MLIFDMIYISISISVIVNNGLRNVTLKICNKIIIIFFPINNMELKLIMFITVSSQNSQWQGVAEMWTTS